MYKCDFKSIILSLTLKTREISFTKNFESVCSVPHLGGEVVYRLEMNRELPGELNLLALERTVICRCIEEARFATYLHSFHFILFFNFTVLYWFCHISTWTRAFLSYPLGSFVIFVLLDSHCAFRPAPGALWRMALRLMEIIVCLEDRNPWELTSSLLSS